MKSKFFLKTLSEKRARVSSYQDCAHRYDHTLRSRKHRRAAASTRHRLSAFVISLSASSSSCRRSICNSWHRAVCWVAKTTKSWSRSSSSQGCSLAQRHCTVLWAQGWGMQWEKEKRCTIEEKLHLTGTKTRNTPPKQTTHSKHIIVKTGFYASFYDYMLHKVVKIGKHIIVNTNLAFTVTTMWQSHLYAIYCWNIWSDMLGVFRCARKGFILK